MFTADVFGCLGPFVFGCLQGSPQVFSFRFEFLRRMEQISWRKIMQKRSWDRFVVFMLATLTNRTSEKAVTYRLHGDLPESRKLSPATTACCVCFVLLVPESPRFTGVSVPRVADLFSLCTLPKKQPWSKTKRYKMFPNPKENRYVQTNFFGRNIQEHTIPLRFLHVVYPDFGFMSSIRLTGSGRWWSRVPFRGGAENSADR